MSRQFDSGYICPDIPDSVLVQQSLQGNHEAFEHLVQRYSPLLTGYISCWCSDSHLVADIEQGVLLQLYLSLSTLRTDQPLRAWLLCVAYYACMSERRRKKPLLFCQFEQIPAEEERLFFAVLPDPDPLPEDLIEQQERRYQVFRAIKALPARQREFIWLKYIDQLSYAEIARLLNVPEGTAKTNVARAKPLLRRLLSQEIMQSA